MYIKVTNVEQDDNTYSNNTIKYVDNSIEDTDTDKSDKDAEVTKADNAYKPHNKQVRRGGRRNKLKAQRSCAASLKLFSANAASVINGRLDSLRSEVICTKANIVTLQETHCRRKGRILIPNFVAFEAIRAKKGGGTLIAVRMKI